MPSLLAKRRRCCEQRQIGGSRPALTHLRSNRRPARGCARACGRARTAAGRAARCARRQAAHAPPGPLWRQSAPKGGARRAGAGAGAGGAARARGRGGGRGAGAPAGARPPRRPGAALDRAAGRGRRAAGLPRRRRLRWRRAPWRPLPLRVGCSSACAACLRRGGAQWSQARPTLLLQALACMPAVGFRGCLADRVSADTACL